MNTETNLQKKLFTLRAIQITTYLLSPIVSGFMIRSNFNNLDEKKKGNLALIFSYLLTTLVFTFLYFIPENILDKIPNPLLPLIYTGIIYYYLEKTQGEKLKYHKENNGEFHSIKKVVAINVIPIVLIVFVAFIAGDLMKEENNYDAELYDRKVAQFVNNENSSLQIINQVDSYTSFKLPSKIRENTTYWKENTKIVESIKEIENIPVEYLEQADLLLEYCNLRIQENEQLKIWSIDKMNFNQAELNIIHEKIGQILNKLQ